MREKLVEQPDLYCIKAEAKAARSRRLIRRKQDRETFAFRRDRAWA